MMKLLSKIIMVMVILSGMESSIRAQEDLSVYNYWQYYGNMSNTLYQHLCSRAFSQLNDRQLLVNRTTTKEEWIQRQVETAKKMSEIFGGFPEKTPLNAVITGKIKKDDFTVEKLYFESRPGYYVTAALFIPAHVKGKKPAILFCCGHYDAGFKDQDIQTSVLNLVKKGFVVFTFDPIGQGERLQYFGPDGKPVFGPTHEHSYPGSQAFLTGRVLANYFIWDGIRAIDYLVGRKEVDPQRIGIAGHSGGATQSLFIAAMDNRIAASALSCYVTSFDKLLRSRGAQDAEQNPIYAIERGIDLSDFIEIRAPKPTLILSATRDFFSIQGARDAFNEAKRAYTVFGKSENINMSEDDSGHDFTLKNREATYAFFQKHLNNPGDPKDIDVSYLNENELTVTPTGQVCTSLKGETLFSLNEKYAQELQKNLQSQREHAEFYKTIKKKTIQLSGYTKLTPAKEYIFSGRLWRKGYAIEKYLIKASGDYFIPVLRLVPNQITGKNILLLDEGGKASAAVIGGLADQLAVAGHHIIIPDLNGLGELSGGFKGGDSNIQGTPMNVWYTGVLTHKFPLTIRVEEMEIICDFMKSLGTNMEHITGIACGTVTPDLLHSAVISGNFDKIALVNPLFSYQSMVQEKNYHTKFVMSAVVGVIGEYDLCDLTAAIAPSEILWINPVNALDEMVNETTFNQTYDRAINEYKKTGKQQNLVISIKESDVVSKISHWLK